MADVIVTMKIMPDSPDVDLEQLQKEALEKIKSFAGMENYKAENVPVAFGLKALQIQFVMAEDTGSTDKLEEDIATIEGVNSVDVTDVRRTIG